MKFKVFQCIILSLLCTWQFATLFAQAVSPAPKLVFEADALNLDTLETGQTYLFTYLLKNVGDAPVQNISIRNTGSCLFAALDGKPPLMAGDSMQVRIHISTEKRFGSHQKVFTILSDDPAQAQKVVRVFFFVAPARNSEFLKPE